MAIELEKIQPGDPADKASEVVYNNDMQALSFSLFAPAFDLAKAMNSINGQTNTLWCNDYWSSKVLGLKAKVLTGTLDTYKLNIKTKEKTFIQTFDIPEDLSASVIDLMFDKEVELEEFERIGVNGYIYYSASTDLTLLPYMYTLQPNGNILHQKDATLAYALIAPSVSKNQFMSDELEKISNDTKSLKRDIISKPIATLLPALTGSYGVASGDNVTSGSYLQVPISGHITELTINSQVDSINHIVIGSVINNIFYEKDRVIFTTDRLGVSTKEVSLNATKGDYIAFYKTSRFMYKVNTVSPGIEDSRFLQFGYPHTQQKPTNIAGWAGLSYRIQENPALDIDILTNGYEKGLFKSGVIAPRDSYLKVGADKWITFTNSPFSYNGVVNKILIDVETAGDITVGVGLIDQRGWAIIDSQITINCPNIGLNEISVNIPLTENQRLFLKSPLSIGVSTGGRHLESGQGNITLSYSTGELLFKYEIEGKRFMSSNLATIQQLNEAKEDIARLDEKVNNIGYENLYMQSPDRSYWKQTIDNNGAVTWVKVPSKKVSVFGNSFDLHPISSLWWGRFGMAASRRENDWVHVLTQMLRVEGILATITPYSIAETVNGNDGWEVNPDAFDYSRLDPYLSNDLDLVIVRIGENVSTDLIAPLEANSKKLIEYIKFKAPNAKIIWGGVFWTNQDKQNAMRRAVESYTDIPFIDFQDLDIPEYKSAIGNKVLGDDGVWHTIKHAGVANHAGDKGQYTMAERIKPYAIEALP